MTGQRENRSKLGRLRQRLERWRQQHGGRGRAIPDELWDEAAAVARVEGLEVAARALRVDRLRLARRVGLEPEVGGGAGAAEQGGFVEVDASRLYQSTKTVLRFEGRDGERLHVELGNALGVDVVALASAFWSRRQ